MATIALELALSCMLSSENNLKKTKTTSYMVATLFHGCSSKFEKHTSYLDAKGISNLKFKDVNVDSDYIRFQVLSRGKLFGDKHAGTINVRVSELVSSPAKGDRKINQEDYATYELVKSLKKEKKSDLKLFYKLSMAEEDLAAAVVPSYVKPEVESKRPVAAIGNDIKLFKMVPSFHTSFVSLSCTC